MDLEPSVQTSRQMAPIARLNAFLDALSQVSVRIGITSDPRQVMESIGRALREMGLGCAVALFEPGGSAAIMRYTSIEADVRVPAEELIGRQINGYRIPVDREPFRQILQEQRTMFVPDALELATQLFPDVPETTVERAVRLAGITANVRLACLPLAIAERAVGALAVWGADLQEEDVPALSLFAGQVASSIENARHKEMLQAVVDSQGEGIGAVDPQERFAFANPAAEAIFGLPPGGLVGRCLLDFVVPESVATVQEQTDRRRRGHKGTYELEIIGADGARRDLLVTATPRTDGKGGYVGAFGIFRDITDRVETQTALLEAYDELERRVAERTAELVESNFRLQREVAERARTEANLQERSRQLELLSHSVQALNSALDTERVLVSIIDQVRRLLGVVACSVWLLDAEGRTLVCQQATGQKSDKVLGWRLPVGEGIVGSAVQAGETINTPDTRVDQRHYKDIDRQTGVELRSILAVPLQVEGKVIGALQVMDDVPSRFGPTDVTLVELLALSAANALENARIHEALQASRQELERRNRDLLILNAIATEIGQSLNLEQVLGRSLDKVLELTRSDVCWVGLFGSRADSMSVAVNRGLSEETIGDLEAAGLHRVEHKERIQSGKPVVMTTALRESGLGHRNSDLRIPATLVAVPIRARERLLGVLGSLFCHSPEIDAQDVQLLVAIGHQLGVAVENVRLLEEASEIEALRGLDRMRSELIATASHELRTPLGLIRIFATALLMDEVAFDSDTHRQFLVGIADETEKLESILDNLLDLSRMESGRLLLDRRPVDLRVLIRDALTRMDPELEGRQVVDLGDEPLRAEVDAARMEQVLRNLLSNACKYSPEGGAITVRGRQTGNQISISVIDRGIGIPPEEQNRIFERFYRVDNDVTRRTRGAGLGLSICKWIVEAHGGSIQVQSEPGKGSEFRIVLPAVNETPSAGLTQGTSDPLPPV